MRINLNNEGTIDQVMELCKQLDISPTRLIIDLIEKHHTQYQSQKHHAQIGCNTNDKKKNNNTE